MSPEEAKKLYEGKYFYEIVDGDWCGKPCKMLFGPIDTIRYVNKDIAQSELDKSTGKANVEFVQVIDGNIRAAFNKNEILVTDRIL